MNKRTLIGFAVALAILIGLAALGHLRTSANDATQSGALFLPQLKAKLDRINRADITQAGDKLVATLARKDAGWVVANKDNYPANIKKIRDVLVGLAKARIVEQKTSNPDYYAKLGVEPVKLDNAAGTEVELFADDQSVAAVTIGNLSGTNYRYIRNSAEPASYLVDKALNVPTTITDWLKPKIVDIAGKQVKQVTITHADGKSMTLSKAARDQQNFTVENIPKGRKLQYPGAGNIVGNALHELKLQDVEAANNDDRGKPEATATYRLFNGLVVKLTGTTDNNGTTWIQLTASVDKAQAQAAAKKAKANDAAKPASTEGGDKASVTAGTGDGTAPANPQKMAQQINARVQGWRYKIASYQYDQIMRRMSDLLKPVPDDKTKETP